MNKMKAIWQNLTTKVTPKMCVRAIKWIKVNKSVGVPSLSCQVSKWCEFHAKRRKHQNLGFTISYKIQNISSFYLPRDRWDRRMLCNLTKLRSCLGDETKFHLQDNFCDLRLCKTRRKQRHNLVFSFSFAVSCSFQHEIVIGVDELNYHALTLPLLFHV